MRQFLASSTQESHNLLVFEFTANRIKSCQVYVPSGEPFDVIAM
jgi:6-phosphogluconolactonase (cycloisomerase 2 family)